MLRVLTLSTLFPDAVRPGFGVFVGHQTRHLAQRPNVALTVISPLGLPPAPWDRFGPYAALRQLPLFEHWEGIPVHRPRFPLWPMIGARLTPGRMARAIMPLVEKLHREQPFDVIDAEFFWPDGPVAMRLAQALGIPFSIKARGADIHYWGNRHDTGPQVLQAGLKADGLLAVSAALRDDMITLGMERGKIRLHYTGVDLATFQPLDRHLAKQALGVTGPLIATIGALIPRKRPSLLIDAMPHLPDARLVLIGKGPQADRLRRQAAAIGVADRVHFTGAITQTEIARWLSAAEVMCLPSASEGLANAWVEALACGTPLVITDVGGARELLGDSNAGRLVAPEPAAIATAIRAMIDTPPDRASVQALAAPFTWTRNSEVLYRHLADLVNRAA